MRFLIAALILAVAAPGLHATSSKSQCKTRCDSNYQFCMNRATTKQAKKSCKADRKTCKGNCR
jgi:hypothetical protein